MEITGTQLIQAPRDAVWAALNNPEVLKQCLPGCESVVLTNPDEFKVVITTAIGPLRARFNGVLRLTDSKPPESCNMVFEGQGGTIGFGKGSSTVTLTETPDGTELAYQSQAHVGGKLAQVGSRLIDSVAKKMADDFFKAFKAQLAPAPVEAVAVAETAPQMSESQTAVAVAVDDVAAAASASAMAPAAATPPSPSGPAPILVPGWWLALAAALGSAATLVGALCLR